MIVCLKKKIVKRRLAKKCLSQNWLAMRAGVSSGYMSQVMNGSRNPSPKLRQKLLDIFPEFQFDDIFIIKENR